MIGINVDCMVIVLCCSPEREGICICKKIKDCCKSKCCKPKKNKYCPCPFPQQHPDACRYSGL